MAFNTRQANYVANVRLLGKRARELAKDLREHRQTFQEEFQTGRDNDLSVMATELAEWGITYDAIQQFCNLFGNGFNNFWENESVTTREYGKFARRIANNE
jgi:DUF438 domain-containing protein